MLDRSKKPRKENGSTTQQKKREREIERERSIPAQPASVQVHAQDDQSPESFQCRSHRRGVRAHAWRHRRRCVPSDEERPWSGQRHCASHAIASGSTEKIDKNNSTQQDKRSETSREKKARARM